ncbi:hypothetical protein AA309_19960 [Microvirga vignae]|uniref:Uncharacterized protein n=1 Tax=Microvirga vignae TaxID=1225564 RepID=A0A0H1R8K6_9HYPH|nr:hypothetical protein [Microvirga vignae]KLK91379.1 hypothetical protein AA309_19960 [Microvirga vignae]
MSENTIREAQRQITDIVLKYTVYGGPWDLVKELHAVLAALASHETSGREGEPVAWGLLPLVQGTTHAYPTREAAEAAVKRIYINSTVIPLYAALSSQQIKDLTHERDEANARTERQWEVAVREEVRAKKAEARADAAEQKVKKLEAKLANYERPFTDASATPEQRLLNAFCGFDGYALTMDRVKGIIRDVLQSSQTQCASLQQKVEEGEGAMEFAQTEARAEGYKQGYEDGSVRLASLTQALEPFVKLAEWGDEEQVHFISPGVTGKHPGMFSTRPDDFPILRLAPGCPALTIGDIRRARAALQQAGEAE